jgi:cellulose synthase/poly-beta-1,6-N-acetylglucosamine synthase-like glycosyltransferase
MFKIKMEITIGIIAKNEERHIKNTLKSLLNIDFDFSKIELIFVDGNSQDKTKEYVKEILKNSKIKYKIINEKDFGFYGPCFARNLIIDNSSENSKYIAFVDADCRVDKNWLKYLYNKIKNTSKEIAGVGGPRLIEKTNDKKELIINNILTSYIASGLNPSFTKRNIKFINSIANYNAIYKKEILKKFRYDNSLIISDDIELNYRIIKSGYKFLYEPKAKIYHRETNSIIEFTKNMFRYGVNISNVVYKHKNQVRIFVPLTLGLILYFISLPIIYFILYYYNGLHLFKYYLTPLFLYLIFLIASFIEIFIKTKTLLSLLVFVLLPLQHFAYGFGFIKGIIKNILKNG